MTYIVTEPCVECKYTDCAAVCPVEAFHELPDKLLINPDTCIDCDACLPECPVEAIFSDMSIPEEWMETAFNKLPKAIQTCFAVQLFLVSKGIGTTLDFIKSA